MSTPLGRLSEDELRDHGDWLRRVARGLVGSETDADDLAQDVWIELARGVGPIAHLRALSVRVARRLAGHRRESDGARARREAAAARPEALPGPDELEGTLEIQRLLLEELTALDEIHRTPLLLHFHEGLSAAEIARRRGVPASTVRSQLARAQAELRARMDRRHGGRREAWVALLARLERPEVTAAAAGAAGGLLMTTLGKTVAAAGALALLAALWRVAAPPGERPPPPVVDAVAPRAAEPRTTDGEPREAGAAGARQDVLGREPALAVTSHAAPADVALRVLDAGTGEPLDEFELGVRDDASELDLTTDSAGRASIAAAWFASPFSLHLVGDRERAFEEEARELGPADRPEPGAELVLRCASGPTYTLLFDAPPPAGAELVAVLSAGSEPVHEPGFAALLHRDGARVWTRFAPTRTALASLGDGPWTLTVLDRAGLWRAHGAVLGIEGVQREPVRLTTEACGALLVDFACDEPPLEEDFHASLYGTVDGHDAEPRYAWPKAFQRSLRFGHLVPGEYRVWLGSPLHETAEATARVDAGATALVRLALVRKPDVGSLKVVVTSQTGTLDVSLVGVMARELASNAWRNSAWSGGESTSTRRVVLFEGLPAGEHEISLSGEALRRMGDIAVAPGRAVLAQAGDREIVFTFLDDNAPPQRSGTVRVLTREGAPLLDAGATMTVGGSVSYHGRTDARGEDRLLPVVEGVPFDLLVRADGFRPRILRDLRLPFEGDELEVRLEPGWGTRLDVVLAHPPGRGPESLEPRPAAGASVLVDGEPAGVLDERGRLVLEGPVAPARIEIRLPGWHVGYGDLDPGTGAFSPHQVSPLWVVLEPDASADEPRDG